MHMNQPPIHQHASVLDDAPILSRLPREIKARLLPMTHEETLASGDVLFKLGDEVHDTCLVLEGEVEIATQSEAVKVGPAGFLGEEAALGGVRYLSSATAKGPVRILRISHHALAEALLNHPSVRQELWVSLVSHFIEKLDFKIPNEEKAKPINKSAEMVASIGWLATLLLPAGVILWGDHFGLALELKLLIAILTATVLMWVFRLVPEFVPGFFAILSITLAGMAPVSVVLSGFSSPSFFMAVSVLSLSAIIIGSGLALRVLLLLLRYMPHNQFCYELNLLLMGIFLTPIVPTGNGRIAVVTPMLKDMLHAIHYANGSRAATRLSAAAFTGSTLFSGIFLTGMSANFVIFGMLSMQLQDQFHWLYWLFAGSVSGIVMLLAYLIISKLMFRNQDALPLSSHIVDLQLKVLGPMSKKEWAAALGIVLFSIVVATYSVHKIAPVWIVLTVLFGLLLFSSLTKEEFQTSIDWPFLMLLGGLLGLFNTIHFLGADKILVGQLAWITELMRDNLSLFILLLSGVILSLRFILPINLTMIILAAIFIPIASFSGINSWLVGFIILTMGSSWFFAYQNGSYTLFKKISGSPYEERNFLVLNILITLIKLLGIYASMPFWHYLGIL